jgi:hypothetical protein
MKLRRLHVAIVILMLASLIVVGLREPLTYRLFGYDVNLIKGSSPDALTAFYRTLFIRNLIWNVSVATAAASLLVSSVAAYRKVYARSYLAYLSCAASLLVLSVYWIAQSIPTTSF